MATVVWVRVAEGDGKGTTWRQAPVFASMHLPNLPACDKGGLPVVDVVNWLLCSCPLLYEFQASTFASMHLSG